MRKIFGGFFILAGLFVFFYLGIWMMFINGIVDAVRMAQGKINGTIPGVIADAVRIIGSSIVNGMGICMFLWGGLLLLPPVKKDESRA